MMNHWHVNEWVRTSFEAFQLQLVMLSEVRLICLGLPDLPWSGGAEADDSLTDRYSRQYLTKAAAIGKYRWHRILAYHVYNTTVNGHLSLWTSMISYWPLLAAAIIHHLTYIYLASIFNPMTEEPFHQRLTIQYEIESWWTNGS